MNKKLIGYCPVDSGMLIIVDPCYALPSRDLSCENNKIIEQQKIPYTYEKLVKESYKTEDGKEIDTLPKEILFKDKFGTGIALGGFGGDGIYPVYAHYDKNGRIYKVTIEF